ncbi:GHMP kinase [Thermincola potens]|uniref:GHMP kinase n=1 Tax=Thermincola potens (strain JR) TaxID=635013 RepID=D5XEV0_THEPJ|nr:GHMP kinase [Thermincola potens]ADG82171.1 GHMP kinase [Thermincola potens JR]
MKYMARAPGTCGELIQGLWNGVNFLVTCPINMYSTAVVELSPDMDELILPAGREKTAAAVRKLLSSVEADGIGGYIHITSDLPAGKGMASSTADITAACVAVAQALGKKVPAGEIARIALSVEPTDGLMFPGIVAFDHLRGKICRPMAGVPDLDILIIDPGGIVDTNEFNARLNLKFLNRINERTVMQALEQLEWALAQGDLKMVGACATTSAYANQKILEKPLLAELHKVCTDFGGVGVNVAHSGTVIGMLFERRNSVDWEKLKNTVLSLFDVQVMGPVRVIQGGAEIWVEREGEGLWQPYHMCMEETCEQQQNSME